MNLKQFDHLSANGLSCIVGVLGDRRFNLNDFVVCMYRGRLAALVATGTLRLSVVGVGAVTGVGVETLFEVR